MRVHFIAIGGAAMHNLAMALHDKGYKVTGSDDEIFEPSKSRLAGYGLLPAENGWFPEKITPDIDAVILGMHARADNPELLRAKETGIQVYSFPEYLYEQSKTKKRVVIGGSHGKTTITAMILHVLRKLGMDCDYMVGAKLEGFDVMVRITETAPVMIFEGDEYLTSPIDPRPKFHLYRPDVALISGIAWDHYNVFKTFDEYVWQFEEFTRLISEKGVLIYYGGDETLCKVAEKAPAHLRKTAYSSASHTIRDGKTYLLSGSHELPIEVFGDHNLANLSGARLVCNELGISNEAFFTAISTFPGASNRLEKVFESDTLSIFRDFAHSPSKLEATTVAVRKQFPDRQFIACMELHTYSSLNAAFIDQYADSMNAPDVAIVYFNPHALEIKRLPMLDAGKVKQAFGRNDLKVFSDADQLKKAVIEQRTNKKLVILLMSSGDFDGLNIGALSEALQ